MRLLATFASAAAAAAVAVAAASARPPGPPPTVAGVAVVPPPAWIEAGATQRWLAYSSYCWRTACVDMVHPAMRPDVPTVTVRRGQVVRLHFGFRPRSVAVSLVDGPSRRLPPARTAAWRPGAGLYLVSVRAPAGDAGYLVRIRLR